ncbi:ATP synthase subunit b, mitochondrial-like [Onthophagus taurus]|uniref:ATP synthase subunit b, mitochondrial-like n=1 Tax=Onthophagus taurus TaxID=166361 RepID=UPI0039BDCD9E
MNCHILTNNFNTMVFLNGISTKCTLLIETIIRPCNNTKLIKIGVKCNKRAFCTTPCEKKEEVKQKPKLEQCKETPKKAESDGKSGGKDDPPHVIEKSRPIRQEQGKVRLGFLPDEWFDIFYPKTGVTGPYIFLLSFGSYLISKEKYVLEHEYYALLSMSLLCAVATKYAGPTISKFLDKEIDQYEAMWIKKRQDEIEYWEDLIKHDEKLQISNNGQLILLNAKRENIKFQLEGIYRSRLLQVHDDVKERLDYQLSIQYIQKKLLHKNLIDWVQSEVVKNYTADKAASDIDSCINELATIAAKESSQTG